MTIQHLLLDAERQLATTSDAPSLDASCLLLHVTHQPDTSWLHAHAHEPLTSTEQHHFAVLVARRRTGEPLAYILGTAEFYGRSFQVTPDVLVPRPATEEVIDTALQLIPTLPHPSTRPFTIADIGTGSGCIAITLALELSSRAETYHLLATDISPAALAVARRNAEHHHAAAYITFLHGSLLEPLANRPIDLIVSNPPYIPSAELPSHPSTARPETRGLTFEPRQALDGGPDGQQFIAAITASGIPAVLEVTGGVIVTVNCT